MERERLLAEGYMDMVICDFLDYGFLFGYNVTLLPFTLISSEESTVC